MLKLRKIQLQGFKSFADKSELTFNGSGIAAIVGPNGCGKSNISDAIAWVLGEQSPKLLRGGRMEDVIFNGTRTRPPLGLAEVAITLVDPEIQRGASLPQAPAEEIQEDFAITEEDFAEPAEAPEIPEDEPPVEGKNQVKPESPALEILLPDGTGAAIPVAAAVAAKRKRRPKMQLKPGELVVSRRLFRSGDSEYLINGRLVRLRDVQDIFMGTGLGPDSYAIIEQGRVGMILSSKPSDRRAVMEEAAGITKFKAKRKLAESKLEQARQNLLRVNDITEEVSRQLNSLKRQAVKARRYRELRGRMRELSRDLFNARALELSRQRDQCLEQLEGILQLFQEMRQAIESHEQEYHAGNESMFSNEDQLTQMRNQLGQLGLELERGQQKISFQKRQLEQLAARIQENLREMERLAGQEGQYQTETQKREELLAEATQQFERINSQFELQSSEFQSAQSEMNRLEAAAEEFRKQLIDCVENAATLRNQMVQLDEMERRLENQISRLALEQEEATLQQQQLSEIHQRTEQECKQQESRLAEIQHEAGEVGRILAGLKEEELLVADRVQQTKERLSAGTHRLKSLEDLASHHAHSTEAVRLLLSSEKEVGSGSFHTYGILADQLEVKGAYDATVEEFLKQELEYLLMDSIDSIKEGIALLHKGGKGRSTFLLCGDGDSSGSLELDQLIREVTGQDHSLVPLSEIIDFPGQYETAFREALPHLFRAVIAPGQKAWELAQRYPELIFLTPEGEVFRGRLISGGGKSTGGHLSLKKEIRDLDRKTQALQKEISAEEGKLHSLRDGIQNRRNESADLERQIQDLEKTLIGADLERKQIQRDLERAAQRKNLATLELERTRQERAQIEAGRGECETQIMAAEGRKAEIENLIAARQESLKQWKDRSSQDSQAISELRSELATFRERKQAAEAELLRLAGALRDCREQISRLNSQKAGWAQEIEEIQASIHSLEESTFQQAVEKASLEAEIRTRENLLQESRQALIALEQQLKRERQQLEEIQNRKTETEIVRARLSSDFAHLEETCQKELGVTLAEIRPETPQPLEEAALQLLDEEYLELKNKMEAMGPVNMMALEEYQECDQRFQFLMTQRQDLIDSIEDTTAAIKEIDQVSREQFREAFTAINHFFQETFQSLFGGGHGEMKLLDEQDELESGIEIIAQPPGKRLQNVLLLSGGEKALTAIALLLAIFRYQPSPFCVLDEVDAPLDEMNTGRFAQMVQGMSQGTQFVIITHSKRTMEVADALYGVTMQEAGVSKLVSVHFEQTV